MKEPRLSELSWPKVAEIMDKPNVIILPMGSTEQHGAHLPLNVDSICATSIAEKAACKVMETTDIYVLIAPTIHYTDVSIHKIFPGTIGIKADTLVRVLCDIVTSLLVQGFRNIILFSSHHENNCPMEMALRLINDDNKDTNVFAITSMGLGFDVRPGLIKAGVAGQGHALEIETSMSMVLQPQNVHLEKVLKGSRKLPLSTRYIGEAGSDKTRGVVYCSGITGFEESGILGDPTMSSKEQGEKIFSAMIKDLADIIVQVSKVKK